MFCRLGLRPRDASCLDHRHVRIVLSRSHSILLLAFEVLNRRLIELQLIVFALIVAKSMDIRGNGGNRLVLVDVDQVLQYFWLGGCACADCLWSQLESFDVAK